MEAQVQNLLLQYDSPFRKDANFAFICWNMIQKKEVSMNTNFQVSASQQHSLVTELKDIGPSLTALANKWTHSIHEKPSSTQEKKAMCFLCHLQASTRTLRESIGYKLYQCNEICALMKFFCTLVLFVTLNPHDLTGYVLSSVVDIDLDAWLVMTSFE
jgi:hypothetical protein